MRPIGPVARHPQPRGRKPALARNTLDAARIPRASKLMICDLFQKGRVLAQDGVFTFFATGTKWRQNEYRYHYYYAYMPQARVVERNGRYYLEVDGVGVSVEVVREW